MNTLILLLIATPLVLLILWQWYTLFRARQLAGRPAPDTRMVDKDDSSASRIYYFHAPHCAPCRAATPLVDRLQQEYSNLIKVDIAEHTELARNFGVLGTPSFIHVVNGRIEEVKLGVQSEAWLRKQLQSPVPGNSHQPV